MFSFNRIELTVYRGTFFVVVVSESTVIKEFVASVVITRIQPTDFQVFQRFWAVHFWFSTQTGKTGRYALKYKKIPCAERRFALTYLEEGRPTYIHDNDINNTVLNK